MPPRDHRDGIETGSTEPVNFMGRRYVFPVAAPPPERFDPAEAKAAVAVFDGGWLKPGLEAGMHAAAASNRALDALALGGEPDRVLKEWQASLTQRAPSAAPALRPSWRRRWKQA